MTTTMPSRADIDRAEPLDFPERQEKQANITIEVAPDGLHIRCEYTGAISSIPAAIERLRQAGVLELVSASRLAAPAPAALRKSAPVTFADDGSPLCGNANCSRRGQPLEPSQHNGYYCKGGKDSVTGNAKGYCRTTSE